MNSNVEFLFWLAAVARTLPGWTRRLIPDGRGCHSFTLKLGKEHKVVVCDPAFDWAPHSCRVVIKTGIRHTERNAGKIDFMDIHGVPNTSKDINLILAQIDQFNKPPISSETKA